MAILQSNIMKSRTPSFAFVTVYCPTSGVWLADCETLSHPTAVGRLTPSPVTESMEKIPKAVSR